MVRREGFKCSKRRDDHRSLKIVSPLFWRLNLFPSTWPSSPGLPKGPHSHQKSRPNRVARLFLKVRISGQKRYLTPYLVDDLFITPRYSPVKGIITKKSGKDGFNRSFSPLRHSVNNQLKTTAKTYFTTKTPRHQGQQIQRFCFKAPTTTFNYQVHPINSNVCPALSLTIKHAFLGALVSWW